METINKTPTELHTNNVAKQFWLPLSNQENIQVFDFKQHALPADQADLPHFRHNSGLTEEAAMQQHLTAKGHIFHRLFEVTLHTRDQIGNTIEEIKFGNIMFIYLNSLLKTDLNDKKVKNYLKTIVQPNENQSIKIQETAKPEEATGALPGQISFLGLNGKFKPEAINEDAVKALIFLDFGHDDELPSLSVPLGEYKYAVVDPEIYQKGIDNIIKNMRNCFLSSKLDEVILQEKENKQCTKEPEKKCSNNTAELAEKIKVITPETINAIISQAPETIQGNYNALLSFATTQFCQRLEVNKKDREGQKAIMSKIKNLLRAPEKTTTN